MSQAPIIAFDGNESAAGRALFCLSALYHCTDSLHGLVVRLIDVADPDVLMAAEAFYWDTGIEIDVWPVERAAADGSPLVGVRFYAGIASGSASHMRLGEASWRQVPTLLALQYPDQEWLSASIVLRQNAAFDPRLFAEAVAGGIERWVRGATGGETAEGMSEAVQQGAGDNVTVVRFQNGSANGGTHKGDGGETVLHLDCANGAGHVDRLKLALEAVNGPWLVLAPEGDIDPSLLNAQLSAAVDRDIDVCLPCRDPVLLDGTAPASLIPGTLFRVSAIGSANSAFTDGEARFWNILANTSRIGALPGPPAEPIDSWLASGLVDRAWYRSTYPDMPAEADPIWHYLTLGWREGRDPNAWFASAWYLEQHPELKRSEEPPLLHFVRQGAGAGSRPHPDFDVAWYSRRHLGLDHPSHLALRHFLVVGEADGLAPAPRPQLPAPDLPAALVDAGWYRAAYPDVTAEADPAAHYFEAGWREGRDPNPWFATRWYLGQNPALRQGDQSPLHHFVREGAEAGCRPHPDFDVAWYSLRYLGLDRPDPEALRHFLTIGLATDAVPSGDLNHRQVRTRLARQDPADRTAVLKRLAGLKRSARPGKRWNESEAELWPALLASDVPDGRVIVLVLYDETSDSILKVARLLGWALPLQEFPLFALIEGETRLRIFDRLDNPDVNLILELPGDIGALRQLAQGLPIGRAVVADEDLRHGDHVRWLRDAGIPVFINASEDDPG